MYHLWSSNKQPLMTFSHIFTRFPKASEMHILCIGYYFKNTPICAYDRLMCNWETFFNNQKLLYCKKNSSLKGMHKPKKVMSILARISFNFYIIYKYFNHVHFEWKKSCSLALWNFQFPVWEQCQSNRYKFAQQNKPFYS